MHRCKIPSNRAGNRLRWRSMASAPKINSSENVSCYSVVSIFQCVGLKALCDVWCAIWNVCLLFYEWLWIDAVCSVLNKLQYLSIKTNRKSEKYQIKLYNESLFFYLTIHISGDIVLEKVFSQDRVDRGEIYAKYASILYIREVSRMELTRVLERTHTNSIVVFV